MAYSAMPTTVPAITVSTTPDELFLAAYREYAPMVRRTILGKLVHADHDLAEDLTQNTFLELFRVRNRYDLARDPGGLLKVMARQAVSHHYRVMRNTREVPTDTGHWSYSNRQMAATGAGYYTPAATGFRTAPAGGAA